MSTIRVGIDIGGTFTDFVYYMTEDDKVHSFKLPSTPDDPSEAVIAGLEEILNSFQDKPFSLQIVHGSTVGTNTLLERKGAVTALITSTGFGDLLQIGRQNRPDLYSLQIQKPLPVVSPDHCFELNERVNYKGKVIQTPESQEIEAIIRRVLLSGIESVAICLLFSFLFPDHEKQIARRCMNAGLYVSCSSEILPVYREYERMSTTSINAYISPAMDRYLATLKEKITLLLTNINKDDSSKSNYSLNIMQSNGGFISPNKAIQESIRCILSGPAGGVVGCEHIGNILLADENPATKNEIYNDTHDTDLNDRLRLISFDMGGTSTDVSLIHGKPHFTTEAMISGCPIGIPVLDIHTIGAGGGSIAWIDPGGVLRVGPESAGADPGPACYGVGSLPTITDANVVLGRIQDSSFLGGKIMLDRSRSCEAMNLIGRELEMSPEEVALGMISVVNAQMERALRVITTERGHDPRDHCLITFGGAGGLHACDLARSLGIKKVILPRYASTLSAFGMLCADFVKDYSKTIMVPGDISLKLLDDLFSPLADRGVFDLQTEGILLPNILIEKYLDMRYAGQSYELTIPFNKSYIEEFHKHHKLAYGYSDSSMGLQIVNIRVKAIGKVIKASLPTKIANGTDPSQAFIGWKRITLAKKSKVGLYRSIQLQPGNCLTGPALIICDDTSALIGARDQACVDIYNNIIISVDQW